MRYRALVTHHMRHSGERQSELMTKNSEAENNPSTLFIRNLREYFSSSVFPFILECGRGWKKKEKELRRRAAGQ